MKKQIQQVTDDELVVLDGALYEAYKNELSRAYMKQTIALLEQQGRNVAPRGAVVSVYDYGDGTWAVNDLIFQGIVALNVRVPRDMEVVALTEKELPPEYVVAKSMCRMNNATGWDPEVFVVDAKDVVIPAYTFLPDKATAAKDGFRCMYELGTERTAYAYWDGFQAEFAVYAQSCHGYGIDYLRQGLWKTLHYAREKHPDAKLTLKNFLRIPQKLLLTAEEKYVAFGCEPSMSAYDLPPLAFEDTRAVPYRSAGGHIHFGITSNNLRHLRAEHPAIVKTLDRWLGIPCVALFDGIDDARRREYYGRAGEYRLPVHGLEYRVLSNAWLSHPGIAHLVMNTARGALALQGADPGSELSDAEVQEIINNCDAVRARKFVEDKWPLLAGIIGCDIKSSSDAQKSKRMWLGGIANELKGYDDIEANWKLGVGLPVGFGSGWGPHSDSGKAMWHHLASTL